MIILEENDLKIYVKSVVAEPTENPKKAVYLKNKIKAKRILMDSMKDHLIPNIGDLDTAKEMFDHTLENLYESNSNTRKVSLKNKIQGMYFSTSESISPYFKKLKNLKDQLKAIRS